MAKAIHTTNASRPVSGFKIHSDHLGNDERYIAMFAAHAPPPAKPPINPPTAISMNGQQQAAMTSGGSLSGVDFSGDSNWSAGSIIMPFGIKYEVCNRSKAPFNDQSVSGK